MKVIFSSLMIFILLIAAWVAPAQTVLKPKEDSLFNKNGEIFFKFHMNDKTRVDSISGIISIDNYKDGEVHAYANRDQFTRFLNLHIDYVLLPSHGSLLSAEDLNMGNWQKNGMNMTVWNFYPTYEQYVNFMSGFASSYPAICKLDTIGTTIQGRLLLSVKISDSVNYDRGVPQVFLTSSIHGDETTGYIMMMHLIDTLLNAYGTSARITNLVNNTQIFINPLANPDGTYKGGNDIVSGATRGNQNGIDMNRNYPDPAAGQHPDGNLWQPETMAFMNYADRLHFNLSMNFHGGAEVVNYPWDTWARLTADDNWWKFVSREYADTCHKYAPVGYFTYKNNGITNGYAWYTITGGRQDYHNYFKHDREVTLEISNTWITPASQLLNYWKYNSHSFFNYIEEANYGINGKVYDIVTNAPIESKVMISTHDIDNSFVYSSLPSGWFFRMIENGSWTLTFSAPGYTTKTITGVSSTWRTTNRLNVSLSPIDPFWPRSFLAKSVSAYQINLSWGKNGSSDPVMIVVNMTNTFGTPTAGTAYTAGSTLPGGGTVIYNGPNTAFSYTGLNPNTTYYSQAWSVMAGNTYSSAAAASATTFCGVYNTFPLSENFGEATMQLPNCWSQEVSSTTAVYKWTRVNSANAGGTIWEMRLAPQNITTTTRLKTYFFNTTGINLLAFSFKYNVRGTSFSGTGTTLKIQSSSDGVNWTDEGWSMVTTSNGNVNATTVNINITHNLNSPTTMVAFVATGNLNKFAYWYIDDVSLKAPGYWAGGTPGALTDWNNGANWGDGNVPGSTTNVYIPSKTYLPLVSNVISSPAQCNNLVISKNATITVGSGKAIQVNGKLTLQGP